MSYEPVAINMTTARYEKLARLLENFVEGEAHDCKIFYQTLLQATRYLHDKHIRQMIRDAEEVHHSYHEKLELLRERIEQVESAKHSLEEFITDVQISKYQDSCEHIAGLQQKLKHAWAQIELHQRQVKILKEELHLEKPRANHSLEENKLLKQDLNPYKQKCETRDTSYKIETRRADRFWDECMRTRNQSARPRYMERQQSAQKVECAQERITRLSN
ncbi:uncharacterized protein JN550_010580 [Neoarthrinium moseri]|uniref:uncharacterized protein n=1 Tax=Neoarthrinium moseri TaxID=1658444 RepID=UPI001FDC4354|nr:uncharacterized protein JN550_010580 [Neoarthrinium moseri]KAI1861949.1 hypothetical protein JN550_010580 [Neoarthrinium moseri]